MVEGEGGCNKSLVTSLHQIKQNEKKKSENKNFIWTTYPLL